MESFDNLGNNIDPFTARMASEASQPEISLRDQVIALVGDPSAVACMSLMELALAYGITLEEYLNPTPDTIKKLELSLPHTGEYYGD